MIQIKFLFIFSLFYVFLTGVQGGGYATYNSHVEQHEQSVQAGKKSVAERLGSTSGLGSSSSSSSNYVDCALCKSGSYYQGNRGYDVGHGYIGLNGGSSQQLSSSNSLSSSSHLNNQVHIPVVTGSSGNYQHETQRVIESQSQLNPTIYIAPSSGHSQSYHQESQKIIESKANPTIYIAPSSGHSESYHQESQKIIESKANPTLLIASNPGGGFHHKSEKVVELQKSVPPTFSYYTPSGSSGNYAHESEVISSSQLNSNPVYLSPNIGSNYQRENHLQLKQTVVPTITYTPSVGGLSESHHESSQIVSSSQQATPVLVQTPTSNLNVYGSSNQHKYVNSYPSTIHYTPYGGGSLSDSEFNSKYVQNSHGGSGLTLLPSYSSGLSLGGLSSSSSSSLNSDLYSHSGSSHQNSLDQYMSESERLARLQAQSINAGGVRTGGSVLNGEFGSSNHLGLGSSANLGLGSSANLGGSGGYKKSQAWEKSSKWASGTEFGSDGQPKNYNLLSTAESEQHNLNGKHAGYKAATTTLDDNGKVSTYSIHTP